MKFAESILDLIGNTPLLRIPAALTGSDATVLAKLEFMNPAGSIKDRMANYVISEEERRGRLKPGDTIIDATSGNTGVAAAMVAAAKGYKAIFVTPTSTSDEKINLIKSFGAQVIMTPKEVASDDPRSQYSVAQRMAEEHGYYLLNQFHNQLNPEAHYNSTGPEIWRQTGGKITHMFAGIGTGGTISGCARFLKEQNPRIRVVGVEPTGSLFQAIHEKRPLGVAAPHYVEGIGTDQVVQAFHPQYVDCVVQVDDATAFAETRILSRFLGISAGGSSGSILAGVKMYADTLKADSVVVFFVCDGGIRYMSKVFCDQWMKEHNFAVTDKEIINVL